MGMQRCGVLIPAFNEAATLTPVVHAALAAQLGPVLVVDDGSTDTTSAAASAAGAEVLSLAINQGKGGAVYAGAQHLQVEVLVLLDADLLNITPDHIRALAEPVLTGKAHMTRGDFKGGRWQTHISQNLTPVLNGQRAIFRDRLIALTEIQTARYGLEVILAKHAKAERWHVTYVPLVGVSQVMKEEKVSHKGLGGFIRRLGMYRDILHALFNRQ